MMATAFTVAGRAAALDYVPLYNATFMGGQYFFQSDRSSLSGNASLLAAPMLRTQGSWAFIPTVSSNYQGTKGVGEGVGSGTLFQQQMDHRAGFSVLHAASGSSWKFKPSMSYKREFLKETRDEAWGRGLFDFEKIAVGFEAENVYRDPFSYRLGVDVFRIRFPNYQSLESSAGVDPLGNPLGRELSNKNVLDTMNYQLSASATRPFPYDDPKVSLQAGYSIMVQDFRDQSIVDQRGQLISSKRRDYLQSLSASVGYPRPVSLGGKDFRLDSSLGLNGAFNSSNQNTFDAARTQFVPDSYSYAGFGLGPSFTLAWGDKKAPAWLGASFRYGRTQYQGRLTQDSDGVYQTSHQYQDRFSTSLNYGYPLSPGFSLKVQTNILWARSNNAYEKTYSYNYRTANYLMGFTYEY
jgi:hypothetical protein